MTREILLFVGGVGVLYFRGRVADPRQFEARDLARREPNRRGSYRWSSMGTSAPELMISVVASLGGSPDLAIGNVMGSNLANVGLVLGISAIVRPLRVSARVVTREVPVMILITALLLPLILGPVPRATRGPLSCGDAVFLSHLRSSHRQRDGGHASAGRV